MRNSGLFPAVFKLRAERKNGQILREMWDKGERQKPGDYQKLPEETFDLPQLPDLKISKKQSHQWQLLTQIPDDRFEHSEETEE